MIRGLNSKTLLRLRDHLLNTGAPKSRAMLSPATLEHPLEGDDEAKALFNALAESMYLMIAADGKIEESERTTLRGAFRELTDNQMRSATIDQLLEGFEAKLKAEGQAKRLDAITAVLREQPDAAEAAFVLTAAAAFADDEIADAENDILNDLADRLDIAASRAEELLDELENESE
jgi:uncharacterized tellurite resistance protein B-like protein